MVEQRVVIHSWHTWTWVWIRTLVVTDFGYSYRSRL